MEREQKKTLILGLVAMGTLMLLLVVIQVQQQRKFWKEIDDFRTDNRLAEFLEWERGGSNGGGRPITEPGPGQSASPPPTIETFGDSGIEPQPPSIKG